MLKSNLIRSIEFGTAVAPGADPGFFLGVGALVSCSTSTPRIPVVSENRKSSQGGRTPCTLPLDPPLSTTFETGLTPRSAIISLMEYLQRATCALGGLSGNDLTNSLHNVILVLD